MTNWLAGMKITAARLNDNTLTDSTTSGLTAATNWTVVSFSGRKVSGITTVHMLVTRTTTAVSEIATNSGNISDTDMCTLPAGWRPPESINAAWGNGSVDGECTITAAGLVSLRSISGNAGIATSTNVRCTAVWISENG
jgi:hypothetical protein